MVKSKLRSILYLLISAALIYIVIMNLSSTTTILVDLKITHLRTQPALLEANSLLIKRVEEMESVQLHSCGKLYSTTKMSKMVSSSNEGSRLELNTQLNSEQNDTIWMNSIKIEGAVNSSRNYAVFSVTLDDINAQDYMFYLPLTTLAWKRIGFSSVILVVGCSKESFADPLIRFVLSRCLKLDAVLIYIYSPPGNAVIISQVGRLFAANILRATFNDIDLVYMVTSDPDLWPLNSDIFRLRSDMAVLSLNVNCCAPFLHHGVTQKMPVMSNIGMRVMTWNKLAAQDSFLPKSCQDILTFLCREFGPVALHPMLKRENEGWYLYQMMISNMIKNWTEKYGSHHVMFIPRNTAVDRIECSRWKGGSSLDGKFDAHMPLKVSSIGTWKSVIPLLRTIYGYESERYNWSLAYYKSYVGYKQLQF